MQGIYRDDGTEAGSASGVIYKFSLGDHIPPDHLMHAIDRFTDLSSMLGWLVDENIEPHIPVIHCPAGDCFAICREGIDRTAPLKTAHSGP